MLAIGACSSSGGGGGGTPGQPGPAGAPTWSKSFGGPGDDQASAVIATADGNYLFAGTWNGERGGDAVLGGEVDGDLWAVKLDAVGNVIWQNAYGVRRTSGPANASQLFTAAREAAGGSLWLAGTRAAGQSPVGDPRSDVVVTQLASPRQPLCTAVVDSGNYPGNAFYYSGDSADDVAYDIWPTSDGGAVVAAWVTAVVRDGNTAYPLRAPYVFKVSSTCDVLWSRYVRDDELRYVDDQPSQLLVREASGGGAVMAINTVARPSGSSRALYRLRVARFDASGSVEWSEQFDGMTIRDLIQIDGDGDGADDDGFVLAGAYLWGGSSVWGAMLRVDPDGNGGASQAWRREIKEAAMINAVLEKCHTLASGERICNYRAVGGSSRGLGFVAFIDSDGSIDNTREFPELGVAQDIRLRQDGGSGLTIYFDIVGTRKGGGWIATVNNILGDVTDPGLNTARLIDFAPARVEFTPSQRLLDLTGQTLIRLTNDGDVEWTQTFDPASERKVERAQFVQQVDDNNNGRLDADDGYLISGESTSNSASSGAPSDVWLVKLDARGELVWQRVLDGFTSCGSRDAPTENVTAVRGGGYVVAGFDGSALRIAALDVNGEVHATSLPLTELIPIYYRCDVRVTSIVETSDPGFAIAVAGVAGSVVLRLDSAAQPLWRKHVNIDASSVHELAGGALVIAGARHFAGEPRVMMLSAGGDVTWTRDYGFGISVFGDVVRLSLAADGDLYLAASQMDGSPGATPTDLASQGLRNTLLWRIDGSGNVRWARIYGAAQDEDLFALATSPDDGAIVAGRSLSFGDRSEAWLLRVGPDGMVSAGCNALRVASAALSAIPIAETSEDYTPQLRPEDMHTLLLASRGTQAPRFTPELPVVARQCEGNASSGTVAPPAARTFHLNLVQGNAAASGVVTSTPNGILCGTAGGGSCGHDFVADSLVFLRVDDGDLPRLRSWAGCDRLTAGQCEVRMSTDREVMTTFLAPNSPRVTFTSVVGLGRVSDNSQLSCRTGLAGTCTAQYNAGQSVTLLAEPDSGEYFVGWGGDCAGPGSVRTNQFTISATRVCTAEFSGATVGSPTVTITSVDPVPGVGTVTSTPVGIVCGNAGNDCSSAFTVGTRVRLEAVTAGGSFEFEEFVCNTSTTRGARVIEFPLLLDTRCAARFRNDIERLTVLLESDDLVASPGHVFSTPTGLDCTSDCDRPFMRGQMVTLHAVPAIFHTFSSWDGCDSVHVDPQNGNAPLLCDVLVDRARSVVAFFNSQNQFRHVLSVQFEHGSALGAATTNRSLGSNISCSPNGGICDALYIDGDEAIIFLTPAAGALLSSNAGCDQLVPASASSPAECHITLTADRVARFGFTLNDAPPLASFTFSPGAPMVNHDITFDASNSTDDNNGIVSYSWDFQDDGIFDALGQVTAFSYTNAGTYTVRLRLTDTLGRTADATRVVTVTFGGGGATLSLTIHGAGNGVVTLLPDQGACSYSGNFGPTTCSYQYPTGTFITLTATAYSGSVVGDWVHCDSISADGLKCFVSLSANRSINVFILPLSP
jgi:hypothetical protein